MATGLTPKLPLTVDPTDGPYGLISDYAQMVKQNFKMLLLTIPGERIMNPDFGVGLRTYLFELDNATTHGEINDRITAQTARYMPFIQLNKINFGVPENSPDLYPYTLSISISFSVPALGSMDTIQIAV